MLFSKMINNPTRGTLNILNRKIQDKRANASLSNEVIEAVSLIQGRTAEIIAAADTAEKAADVIAVEVSGACPQHITTLALIGTTSDVRTATSRVMEESSE